MQQAHIAIIKHRAAGLICYGHKIHDENKKRKKGNDLPRCLLRFCRVEKGKGKPAQKHRKDQKQPDFHGFYQLAAVPRKKQGIEIGVALQMHKAPNFFLIRFQILFLDGNIGKRA